MFENAICFDGSVESAQAIADALAPRRVRREIYNGRPRLILEGQGVIASVFVYSGEYVSTREDCHGRGR